MRDVNFQANWNYPTPIRFGVNRINELADICRELNIKKPLLVTDPGLAKLPMLKKIVDEVKSSGLDIAVFSEVKGNPNEKNVMDGVAAFKAGKHDGVIAFGGGSAMDAGKTIALMSGQTRPLWDFEDKGDNYKRVDEKGVASIVAVPTTSGTGSEVGCAALIVDEAAHSKKIIFHSKMLPAVVICDPALTTGVPAKLTAATGMDALAHNLEAFCSPSFHPMSDGIALEGMRLIKENLPIAVRDGNNLTARAYMMVAATMGATAFQKGLGAIHSLSHPVGAIYDAHHGLLNAIFMPYVLAFNQKHIEDKMIRLAKVLDLPEQNFNGVLNWVLEFCEELQIPKTLREIGVDEAQADKIAELALQDGSTPTNPRPLTVENLKKIFLAALDGDLESLQDR